VSGSWVSVKNAESQRTCTGWSSTPGNEAPLTPWIRKRSSKRWRRPATMLSPDGEHVALPVANDSKAHLAASDPKPRIAASVSTRYVVTKGASAWRPCWEAIAQASKGLPDLKLAPPTTAADRPRMAPASPPGSKRRCAGILVRQVLVHLQPLARCGHGRQHAGRGSSDVHDSRPEAWHRPPRSQGTSARRA